MTFKAKLIAGIGIALAILVFICVLSYRSVLRSKEGVHRVTHTDKVLEHVDGVLTGVIDAETGQRGFIITGDESYLQPYNDSVAPTQQHLKELRELTSDNPVQQRSLDRLEPLIATRSNELSDRIEIRRQRGLEGGVKSVRDGTGKETMNQIRAVLGEMTREEQRLMALRLNDMEASTREMEWVLLVGNCVCLLFLSLAGLVIFQEMAHRRSAEEKISELNADLEKRVAELREQTEDLARSNGELQQFAYVASHDLQEPLRMVSSFTQLLAKRYNDKLDDDAREFIHYAVDGATRLQTLISDLLTYSRVGTHAKPLQLMECDPLLDRVLNGLKLAIEDAGATITRDSLPAVMADAGQLGQLLQNLFTNAMKFHGEEPPRIHVSATNDGSLWKISVRDNGIGIPPEHADRIWAIFQRLHTKAEYPGTGIGLAICKKIAERHGGSIWVEPSPGGGSTFCFTIPVVSADQSSKEKDSYDVRTPVEAN